MAQLWRAQVSGGAAIWAPVNGPGTPTSPTIGTIVSGETTLTIPYLGPVTHYRVYEIGSAAPAWIAVPPSPIVFTGTVNTEYNVEVSGDGENVADSAQAGTLNPGVGGGPVGIAEASGGSAFIGVLASGSGTGAEAASGAGSAFVSVVARGAGSAAFANAGGGSAFVGVTARGAGLASGALAGGGSAIVAVLARGAGSGFVAVSGGGSAFIEVLASGGGSDIPPGSVAYPLAGLTQPYPLAGLTQT